MERLEEPGSKLEAESIFHDLSLKKRGLDLAECEHAAVVSEMREEYFDLLVAEMKNWEARTSHKSFWTLHEQMFQKSRRALRMKS